MIKLADGTKVFEAIRSLLELHTMADCGSVGVGASIWLHSRGFVYGTHVSDIWAHDAQNSVQKSLVDSGLWLHIL